MWWRIGLGMSQGEHHKLHAEPCQDYGRYILLQDGEFALVCIADGAGTASHGGLGAKLAIEETISYLCVRLMALHDESLIPKLFIDLMTHLQKVLETKSKILGIPLKQLASTFVAAIFTPQAMYSLQIGDGFIVVRDPTKGLILWSDHLFREYINETNFLTDLGIAPKIKAYYNRCSFWAMATDGLEAVAIDQKDNAPFPGFFQPFQDYLLTKPSEQALNDEVQNFVNSKKLHARVKDDITLAVGGWDGAHA